MDWLRPFVVAGAVTASLVGAGQAADVSTMPPPVSIAPRVAPSYAPRDVFPSGWYVRGDLGAYWGLLNAAQSSPPFPDPTNNSLGKGMTASIGAGIKGDWLRTDVTIDYRAPMDYQGSVASPNDTTARIQATTGLFNGYLDLGTWYHMTPYIGAGAGAAYVRLSDYVSTAAPGTSGDTSKNQWKFAWAGMAGVAFPVSHNLMVDVGYRYLGIGNVSTGSDAVNAMTFKNVAAHEVRVGLRWSFDELRIR